MTERSILFLFIIIISTVTVLLTAVTAQAPASAPYSGGGSGPSSAAPPALANDDCQTVLLNMSDCLTYVETGSNLRAPDKNCCPELAGLLEGNPICLCQLLGGNVTQQYGITLDYSKALNLPTICRLNTPPLSLCSAVGYPVAAPTSGEGSISPGDAGSQAPEGFAASPSTGGKDKGGDSSITRPAYYYALFAGLAFATIFF